MSRRRRDKRTRRSGAARKGFYVLPSLFTTGSLFCGFFALISAAQGHWQESAVAVFVSLLLDGLDGKVARLTRTTSSFGVEYDSLADLVAFGVAPAFLIHQWALTGFGRLGWIAAFLFVVCGALRLARFNIQAGQTDPRYFVGLPIPAAASILAAAVLVIERLQPEVDLLSVLMLVLLYVLSFLMVSTLPYRSAKVLELRRFKSFNLVVAGVLIFSVVAYRPGQMALVLLGVYLISGPILALKRLRSSRRAGLKEDQEVEAAG